MKKILSFFLLFGLGFSAYAEVVSESTAREVAAAFVSGNVSSARKASKVKLNLVATSKTVLGPGAKFAAPAVVGEPSFYIYNMEEGGFVIVAAEDALCPVLGFSDEGSIDMLNLPPQLKYMLECYDAEAEYAREKAMPRHPKWDNNGVRKATVLTQLETASWDQESPYNLFCPMIKDLYTNKTSTTRTITGCVATAASIVCRYHKWPTSVKAVTLPSYRYDYNEGSYPSDYRTVPAHTLSTSHNYDNMPLKYTSSATTAQKEAVAHLMVDIGKASKMMYGTSSEGGSGAYTEDLVTALVKYFGYKSTANLVDKPSSSSQLNSFYTRLQNELKNNGPIIYGGVDRTGGGHQFVLDGSRDDNYFHVNWGWSGSSNGWFSLSSLGGSSVGYTFNLYQDAILDLAPDKIDSLEEQTSLSYDRTTHKLTVKCAMAATTTLKDAAGASKYSKSATAGQSQTIDLTGYAAGKYTLNLTSGTLSYSVTIKL